jgi:branched-chain amino acid transport system substrate-binding protein
MLAAAGCGGGGVEEGATVSIYAAAPLCAGARRELAREGPRVGEVRVRAVCLGPEQRGGRIDLAAIGANARRAAEDTSTVGYIGETSPAATRFSSTILESAGIAQVPGASGNAAMSRLLGAIKAAGDAGNMREAVEERISSG